MSEEEVNKEDVKPRIRVYDGEGNIEADNKAPASEKKLDTEKVEEKPQEQNELSDDAVLTFLSKKYEKENLSYEDLFKVEEKEVSVEVNRELPEDVATFMKFKEETGRGLSDFIELQRDFASVPEDMLIHDHIKSQNPHFTNEDVVNKMKLDYGIDEDHEEADIMRIGLRKKEAYGDALSYFEKRKENYKAPLESREAFIPQAEREAYNEYLESKQNSQSLREAEESRRQDFMSKTKNAISDEFKGFEFKFGDENKSTYKVEDVNGLREQQSSVSNFIKTHFDENGMVKDAGAYHKAMFAASNADKIAKWAYDQGASNAIEKNVSESKNIDMSARKKPESSSVSKEGNVRVYDGQNSQPRRGRRRDGGLSFK